MKKNILKLFLLLTFTTIISQKIHSQEIDVVNRSGSLIVLPTFNNIMLAFTDENFVYNIMSKYNYSQKEDFLVARSDDYYAIKTSSNKLLFRCLPIDKVFFALALKDYQRYVSPSPEEYEGEDGVTYVFERKTNGMILSITLIINKLGGDIFVTINKDI
ncbi:hypothetical protein [Capnocytophaga sputigena]